MPRGLVIWPMTCARTVLYDRSMKRALAALFVVAALLAPSSAQAGTTTRRYVGTVSDGRPIGFKILRAADGELGLRAVWFDYALTCPSGRILRPDSFAMVYGDRLGYPMDGHHLDYLFFDGRPDTIVHGVFRAHSGSGTLSLSASRVTKMGNAVQCTSGSLDWTVHRS
jgi:hypothetical protein